MRRSIFVLCLAVAACGGDDGGGGGPDAADDGYTLRFRGKRVGSGGLEQAAVRDGDGAWQTVTLDAAAEGSVQVRSGRHQVAVRCWYSIVWTYGAGAPDEPFDVCADNSFGVAVSGTTSPGHGRVALRGVNALVLDGDWQANVWPGTHDVLAMSESPFRVEVLRDQVIDAPRTIALSPATRGVALVSRPASSSVVHIIHTTRNGSQLVFSAFDDQVLMIPASARIEGDRVVVTGASAAGDAFLQRVVTGETVPPLEARAGLPAITADRSGAHPSGTWDRVVWQLRQDGPTTRTLTLTASADWSRAAGTDTIALPDLAALPGDLGSEWWPAGSTVSSVADVQVGDPRGDLDSRGTGGSLVW